MSEKTDHLRKAIALNFYVNIIETGNHDLSAEKAKKQGRSYNELTDSQVKIVADLRRLINEEKELMN